MASIAALNHGGRCVRELSEFDQLMGWSFRDYRSHAESADDDLELDAEYLAAKHQELTRTAFDLPVRIPDGFVAPSHAQPSIGKGKDTKKKKKLVQSRAYSKRATGQTASSAAKQASRSSDPSPRGKKATDSTAHERSSSPVSHATSKRGASGANATNSELRALMDAERRELQRRAAAKEAELRAVNRWVFDKRDVDQKPRKVAWHLDAAASPPLRAKSPAKTSVAPHVSDWRPQPRPSHPSRLDEREQWRRRERARREQQQRRAMTEDVAATIDAFEERMEHWAL
ncbi:hypothetical protein PINS_up012010 [Pythium insidiosum]|nr:hypothetical protein PINS_up012010 [Pythium insidiosum]